MFSGNRFFGEAGTPIPMNGPFRMEMLSHFSRNVVLFLNDLRELYIQFSHINFL